MSLVPITLYGDKILSKTVEPVKKVDTELIMNIHNMFETMRNANGIGLAANQVGLDKKFFVIDLTEVEGYESFKPVVMINPEIMEESEDNIIMEEGCLSLPYIRSDVERAKEIKVKYLTPDETEEVIEADDLFARVILHEYDHLVGKMIPDRISAAARKRIKKELQKISKREFDITYPVTEK